MKKERLLKVIKNNLIIIFIGIIYAVICRMTGYGIPCGINALTGIRCAGCGVSRMCLELIHLRFYSAYTYNRVLFLSMPVVVCMYIKCNVTYILTGDIKLSKVDNTILYVLIGILCVWTIYRNLYGI